MCGIAGYFSGNGQIDNVQLSAMVDKMSHRGPDACGFYIGDKVGMGHRRLSIIDLSDNANQPMYSHSGKYAIVFNGEIYNYSEIAKEFGIRTRTTSDTEVIVEAFEMIGPRIAERLNGMFAIAICEIETQRLFLFRDRLGVKPLFYYLTDNEFAFASELKSFESLKSFQKSKSVNTLAVRQFLHLGYVPAPNTIYNNVYKFPQAQYAVYDGKSLSFSHFWNLGQHVLPNPVSDEFSALDRLQNLVESSVRYRLISDVPYGTLLSGGVDSSLVTAVARKVSGDRINTFSIGFKDSKHDESRYSEHVAKCLDTRHNMLMMTEQDAIDRIADMFYYYDEPYADSSALPTMLVSSLASGHVKMVLTGDGGDELFLGYGMYRWAERLANPLVKTFRKPVYLASKFCNSRYQRIGKMFDWRDGDNLQAHVFSQEQYLFTEAEVDCLAKAQHSFGLISDPNLPRAMSPSEIQSMFDLSYYLPDDLLVKVDRASMRYSLESRVPLLDYRLVEFAISLHRNLKINGAEQKYILKQLLYKYLPKDIFNRPKWGFSVPLCRWLRSDLRYLAEEYLNKQVVESAHLVDWSETQRLLHQFYDRHVDYLYNRVWVLVCLHQWWKNRFDK